MTPAITRQYPTGTLIDSFPALDDYVSKYGDNQVVMEYLYKIMDNHIQASHQFMKACAEQEHNRSANDAILAYMREMDTHIREVREKVHTGMQQVCDKVHTDMQQVSAKLDTGNETYRSGFETVTETLKNAAECIGARVVEKVTPQLLQLVQIINTASSQLDMDAIKARVSSSLEGLMATGRAHTAEQLQQAVQGLREDVSNDLTAPLHKLQDEMFQLLARLPSDIEQKVSSASATDRGNVQALLQLQQNLQQTMSELNTGVSGVKEKVGSALATLTHLPVTTKDSLAPVFQTLDKQGQQVHSTIQMLQQQYRSIEKDLKDAVTSMRAVGKETHDTTERTERLLVNVKGVGDAVGQLANARIKAAASSSIKGRDSEDQMHDLLSSKLSSLDGYSVELCARQAKSCDIEVRRPLYPTIRIENKAYEPTLPRAMVDKFEGDLQHRNNHGILCSQHSNISGRANLEFRKFGDKWAVYLAGLEYNVDLVVSVIHILYKLDAAADASALDVASLVISHDVIKQIQSIIKLNATRLEDLNRWMLDGQKRLKEMKDTAFGEISRLLQDVLERSVDVNPGHGLCSSAALADVTTTTVTATVTTTTPATPATATAASPVVAPSVASATASAGPSTATASITSAAASSSPTATSSSTVAASSPAPMNTLCVSHLNSVHLLIPENFGELMDLMESLHLRPSHIPKPLWLRSYACTQLVCKFANMVLLSTPGELSRQPYDMSKRMIRYRFAPDQQTSTTSMQSVLGYARTAFRKRHQKQGQSGIASLISECMADLNLLKTDMLG